MPDEDDQTIEHQDDVEAVIDERLSGAADGGTANAFVAAAVTAHALNSTFSDTEVEAALNALGTKINSLRTAMINSNILPAS